MHGLRYSVVKSLYTPLIILSPILGGTGDMILSVEVVILVARDCIHQQRLVFISLGDALLVW